MLLADWVLVHCAAAQAIIEEPVASPAPDSRLWPGHMLAWFSACHARSIPTRNHKAPACRRRHGGQSFRLAERTVAKRLRVEPLNDLCKKGECRTVRAQPDLAPQLWSACASTEND